MENQNGHIRNNSNKKKRTMTKPVSELTEEARELRRRSLRQVKIVRESIRSIEPDIMLINSKKSLMTFLITKLVGNVQGLNTIIDRLFRCPLKVDGQAISHIQNQANRNEVFEPNQRGRKAALTNIQEQIDSFLAD